MDVATFYTACILGGLILMFLWLKIRGSNRGIMPPTPPGHPLVGNWFQLDFGRMHIKFNEWFNVYGGLLTIRVFTDRLIVLQGAEILREASLSPDLAEAFSGRKRNFVGTYVLPNDVVFQPYNGKTSRLKKALTKGMKLYGSDLKSVQELVLKEVALVAENFRSRDGEAFSPVQSVHDFLCRIIIILLVGKDIPVDGMAVLINRVDSNLSYLSNPGINTMVMLFPWMRHLPCQSGRAYQQITRDIQELKNLILKEEGDSGDDGEIKGLLGHLRHVQREGDVSQEHYVTDDNIGDMLIDICAAGVQTTKMYMLILILVFLHRPDIQRDIQREIDQVLGGKPHPSMDDRKNMPFTEATMIEVLRFHSPLPIGLPQSAVRDVIYRGYHIPKDTPILKNFWTLHHDKSFWDEPHKIKPQRFLDSEGKLLPLEHPNRKRVIPFSLGQRICPGEAFAKHRIFLWVTCLLQQFSFLPGHTAADLPPLTPDNFEPGVVRGAKHFTMRVVPRTDRA